MNYKEKNLKKIQSCTTGFTLIELLVVIFIISLLTSVSFLYYRSGEKNFLLLRSAFKFAQDIRRTEEMAISIRECCGGIIPPAYGIYLKAGDEYYLLYADTNPAGGNEKYNDGDTQIEKIYFEKGVYIKSVSPSPLSINFKPPDPKVRIGNGVEQNEVSIIIALKDDPTKTKVVKVNKFGLIYVE
jgi:prepilin-type N-terminal cleavage/methylation domain-containing protein